MLFETLWKIFKSIAHLEEELKFTEKRKEILSGEWTNTLKFSQYKCKILWIKYNIKYSK